MERLGLGLGLTVRRPGGTPSVPPGDVDGGAPSTASFAADIDGGAPSTASFAADIDGGTS